MKDSKKDVCDKTYERGEIPSDLSHSVVGFLHKKPSKSETNHYKTVYNLLPSDEDCWM